MVVKMGALFNGLLGGVRESGRHNTEVDVEIGLVHAYRVAVPLNERGVG